MDCRLPRDIEAKVRACTPVNSFEEFHYPGYRCHRGGRASGGMSLLIQKSIIDYVEILKSDSYHCWCKLNKALFNWDSDLFICFVYIPPSSSTLLKSGVSLNFETLQIECASFEDRGWVLLLGDTNARTNCVNDFIENTIQNYKVPAWAILAKS